MATSDVTGPAADGARRGDAGGDFFAADGAEDAAGGRFSGADGVALDLEGVDADVIAVFASDVECALETSMRVTGVVLAAGLAAAGLAAFTGVRAAGACAPLGTDFGTAGLVADVPAGADFAAARCTARRLAAGVFAAFFATCPPVFFTGGRDGVDRDTAVLPLAFFAGFAAVFFVAFFAATLRAGAFFIALPLRDPKGWRRGCAGRPDLSTKTNLYRA